MRIFVASDLHGSYPALQFLRAKMEELKPDMLLLLGDLVYHGPRNPLPGGYDTKAMLEAMPEFADLPCPVIAVRGNCDAEVDVAQMPFPMPESAWIDADGLRFFASHGHHLPENPPLKAIPENTVIMRGHTHVPRGEFLGGYHFCNPGSLSLPKQDFPPSYGFYADGIFKVFSKNGQKILEHVIL